MTEDASTPNAIELATELTIAWLSNPNTRATAEEVPAYSEHRRAMAHKIGLGARGRAAKGAAAPASKSVATATDKVDQPAKAKRAPRRKAQPKSDTATS